MTAHGYRIFRDGNAWGAIGPNFVDIQESPSGWGPTPREAYERFIRKPEFIDWRKANDLPLPAFEEFEIEP